jgi:hypothetical protein
MDNEPIGVAVDLLVDRESGRPQWLVIGLWRHGNDTVAVPVDHLKVHAGSSWVPLSADLVCRAPNVDLEFISADLEAALCRHYECRPTRGAQIRPDERRATSARAFWLSEADQQVAWLPGPRR